METVKLVIVEEPSVFNSDPTYEAWKQIYLDLNVFDAAHSDPTYQAWKRWGFMMMLLERYYSDPTYEAWKPGNRFYDRNESTELRSYL